MPSCTWNPAKSRNDLNEDTRTNLLLKYEVKNEFQALAPLKLKELLVALTPSIVKRDEYQSRSQV